MAQPTQLRVFIRRNGTKPYYERMVSSWEELLRESSKKFQISKLRVTLSTDKPIHTWDELEAIPDSIRYLTIASDGEPVLGVTCESCHRIRVDTHCFVCNFNPLTHYAYFATRKDWDLAWKDYLQACARKWAKTAE